MRRSRKITGLALLGCIALGLRLGAVWVLYTDHSGPVGYEHGQIAENLLAGRGFSIEFLGTEGPTSQQAPFYPMLLAAVYSVLGVGTSASVVAVQLLQCLAGTALTLAVVWLAWSLIPDRPSVGWVAGVGAAIYPPHVYMVTHLQVALWAALVLTLLLAVVTSRHWRTSWGGAILAGTLAGLLLLIEPILAIALPILAVASWLSEGAETWMGRFSGDALLRLGTFVAAAVLVIAPWTARNWMVHGEPVFIKSTFGYAFWQANNPISWGTDKIPKQGAEQLRIDHDGTLADMDRALWEARHETLYIDDVLLKPTRYREFQGLSEPERSRLLGNRARDFIRENPNQYAKLCLKRLQYFLTFDETNPKATNRLYRLSSVTWLVLVLVGAAISLPRWRELWPTYAIFLLVALFHSLVIVSARFRIPVEPLSFVWAAMPIAPVITTLVNRTRLKVYRPGEKDDGPFGRGHVLRGPHYERSRRRVS